MAKVLFLDESGDHSLSRIDPQYPVFVLCGVILDETYHETSATALLDAFKMKLFGTREIILHTLAFTRDGIGFESMVGHEFRSEFFHDLELLIGGLDFKVVACVIRKQHHFEKYGVHALDPYILSLSLLVERFVFECGPVAGTIVAEARDPTLNNALKLAFLDLKIRGTRYVSAIKIQKSIRNFWIRDKRENIAGLQIADVVATPIGRHSLGKPTYPKYCAEGDFFSVIRNKFRQTWDGKIEGMGLIVLPK